MSFISSHSSAASLSAVMAPPAPIHASSVEGLTAHVRMTTFTSNAPLTEKNPNPPLYGPLGAPLSNASIMSIVRLFGAPVMLPPGNAARTHRAGLTSRRLVAVTVETSWCTVSYDSTRIKPGTVTEPGSETRPRSLRRRSTIIKFSARSLAFVRSVSAAAASAAEPRGRTRAAVPLIGFASNERTEGKSDDGVRVERR